MNTQAQDSEESHIERIICPNCEHVQNAVVEHTAPWWSYVHECKNCKHVIMESEWQKYEESTAYYDELKRGVLGALDMGDLPKMEKSNQQ